MKIHAIPAFSDNYIWAIEKQGKAIIVDPGDAEVVKTFMGQQQVSIDAILITHWHPDHTDGLQELKKVTCAETYGPFSDNILHISQPQRDKSQFTRLGINFEVMTIPGHTLDHIAFYCHEHELLFIGDTLFAGGCGRMFEGTPELFHHSLNRVAQLPTTTKVYCAHEYTLANLKFASAVEPENIDIQKRLTNTRKIRAMNKITLPTNIGTELATNPFLRTQQPDVINAAIAKGAKTPSPIDVFASLREWKDHFNG